MSGEKLPISVQRKKAESNKTHESGDLLGVLVSIVNDTKEIVDELSEKCGDCKMQNALRDVNERNEREKLSTTLVDLCARVSKLESQIAPIINDRSVEEAISKYKARKFTMIGLLIGGIPSLIAIIKMIVTRSW